MENTNVVYLYTNLINGKQYVGQTVDFKRRHRQHILGHDIKYSLIEKAIAKYGIDNFSVRILEAVPHLKGQFLQNYLNKLEVFYIDKLKPEYNLSKGGEYSPMRNRTHSKETREKMSCIKKGRTLSEETKEKIRIGNEGKVFSKESRMKLASKKSNTGIYKLRKKRSKRYIQGFSWCYTTPNNKSFSSVSLPKLLKKLEDENIELIILNEEKAKKTFKEGDVE